MLRSLLCKVARALAGIELSNGDICAVVKSLF
jgi:hypothetical protein